MKKRQWIGLASAAAVVVIAGYIAMDNADDRSAATALSASDMHWPVQHARMLRPPSQGPMAATDLSFDHGVKLRSIDADREGLRDDVEAEIRQRYTKPAQQRAVLQFARAQQAFLALGASPSGARQGIAQLDQSIACLRRIVGPTYLEEANRVTAMMLDTEERFAAYARATDNLAGQAVDGFEGDSPCE